MPTWLPLLLGFLTALNPISTDMYLPAFPAIETTFGSASGGAQITLAAWFLGLAVGQVTQGTLSDRFGRRGPLMVGTLVYTAASIGCALAPSMGWLTAFRFLAAFGGSASAVIPRAVVRDTSEGLAAARIMSRLMLVMGAAPILAPSLGGLLLGVASWRAIFWVSAAYGALSCLLVFLLLPDTLKPEYRTRLSAGALLARYIEVVTEPVFLSHALMGSAMMFAMFAYLSGAPSVFIEGFGVSPQFFAAMFGVNAVGFIGGSQFNPMFVARFGPGRVMSAAVWVAVASAGVMVLSALTGLGGMWGVFVPVILVMAASSFILPNTAVGALSRHGTRAGTASALLGTLQFSIAAVSSLIVGLIGSVSAVPMAVVMLTGALLGLVADRFRTRSARPQGR